MPVQMEYDRGNSFGQSYPCPASEKVRGKVWEEKLTDPVSVAANGGTITGAFGASMKVEYSNRVRLVPNPTIILTFDPPINVAETGGDVHAGKVFDMGKGLLNFYNGAPSNIRFRFNLPYSAASVPWFELIPGDVDIYMMAVRINATAGSGASKLQWSLNGEAFQNSGVTSNWLHYGTDDFQYWDGDLNINDNEKPWGVSGLSFWNHYMTDEEIALIWRNALHAGDSELIALCGAENYHDWDLSKLGPLCLRDRFQNIGSLANVASVDLERRGGKEFGSAGLARFTLASGATKLNLGMQDAIIRMTLNQFEPLNQRLFWKGGSGARFLGRVDDTNRICLTLIDDEANSVSCIGTGWNLTTFEWNDIYWVIDRTNDLMHFYRNGEETISIDISALTGNLDSDDDAFYIGYTSSSFQGLLSRFTMAKLGVGAFATLDRDEIMTQLHYNFLQRREMEQI